MVASGRGPLQWKWEKPHARRRALFIIPAFPGAVATMQKPFPQSSASVGSKAGWRYQYRHPPVLQRWAELGPSLGKLACFFFVSLLLHKLDPILHVCLRCAMERQQVSDPASDVWVDSSEWEQPDLIGIISGKLQDESIHMAVCGLFS